MREEVGEESPLELEETHLVALLVAVLEEFHTEEEHVGIRREGRVTVLLKDKGDERRRRGGEECEEG